MDSLAVVELVMHAESDLGVTLAEADVHALRDGTAADLWRLVVAARSGRVPSTAEPLSADPIWHQVRGWLALRHDVPAVTITPAQRLLP
jgi:hypothetical protein